MPKRSGRSAGCGGESHLAAGPEAHEVERAVDACGGGLLLDREAREPAAAVDLREPRHAGRADRVIGCGVATRAFPCVLADGEGAAGCVREDDAGPCAR